MIRWHQHSTRAYTRTQARGATPELRRVTDTTSHGLSAGSKKHWKTRETLNTLVYCGRFPRANKNDCIAQNTFHKISAKH